MMPQTSSLRPINLRSADPAGYACLNRFKNTLRHEVWPDDPPVPSSEDVDRWKSMPSLIEDVSWAAWDGTEDRITAFAEAFIYHTGDNTHRMESHIEVLPELRLRVSGGSSCA